MTKQLLIGLLFLCTLLIAEHAVFLPFIVLCYHLAKHPPKQAFKNCAGLFIALFIYVIYFALHATSSNFTGGDTSFANTYGGEGLIIARVLWMAPQIFIHVINLILFPLHLSIDQTALVHFSNSYFSFYSIFCLLVSLAVIAMWVMSFKRDKAVFVLLSGFLISLVPFLQIISPVYCLAAERYLYMPLFMLVLGIGGLLTEGKGFHNADCTVKKLPGLDDYVKRIKAEKEER